jgi:Matrixin
VVDGAVAGGLDIETVALHELGHLLGLNYSAVAGTVMWPTVSYNSTLRTLQPDDLAGIRAYIPLRWQVSGFSFPRLDTRTS